MARTGATNSLVDVEGLSVGHFTDIQSLSGCTVVLCPEGATAGVDVRGSAPGSRETDLLAPHNLVEKAHAVILTGGSVYGLSTADGVVRRLSDAGIGFPLSEGFVAPIVPAVALFDLGRGRHYIPPIGPEWGKAAYDAASNGPVPLGCVGAGTGAVSGGIKGGIGSASEILDSGITVAALIAVNSLGSTLNPTTGMLWEIGSEVNGEFGLSTTQAVVLPESRAPESPSNTTIGVVAVDACLTKAQAQKIAQMAHDGLARAIRPAHTMFDGDTIFCLSTGTRPLPVSEGFFQAPYAQSINEIGRAAADCTARAIVRAVLEAVSVAGIPSLCDLESRS